MASVLARVCSMQHIEVRIDTIDRVGEYLEIAVGSGATPQRHQVRHEGSGQAGT